MSEIKCSCGEPNCNKRIVITDEGLEFDVKDSMYDGRLVYLDENNLAKLIMGLQKVLLRRVRLGE